MDFGVDRASKGTLQKNRFILVKCFEGLPTDFLPTGVVLSVWDGIVKDLAQDIDIFRAYLVRVVEGISK